MVDPEKGRTAGRFADGGSIFCKHIEYSAAGIHGEKAAHLTFVYFVKITRRHKKLTVKVTLMRKY